MTLLVIYQGTSSFKYHSINLDSAGHNPQPHSMMDNFLHLHIECFFHLVCQMMQISMLSPLNVCWSLLQNILISVVSSCKSFYFHHVPSLFHTQLFAMSDISGIINNFHNLPLQLSIIIYLQSLRRSLRFQ